MAGRNFCVKDFSQEGFLAGRNFCVKDFSQEGILAERNFCVKEFLSVRNLCVCVGGDGGNGGDLIDWLIRQSVST